MDVTVDSLCSSLVRSRLLSVDEVKAARRRWQEQSGERAGSLSHFTRWLVKEQLVTEYQASLLANGVAGEFFLDEYKILERVGRGHMAGVYKAARPDGQVVAVKVLPPSRARIPALVARFEREARLSLKFDHPNVVRSLSLGETKGLHYLVMELLQGETLDEVLQRRKTLPAVEAAFVIRQAFLGLEHLHEHGIVHRDLKPANLMLVPGGDTTLTSTVKILDVGLARPLLEDSVEADRPEFSELTQEGVLLGTPDYLSPEQARDPRNIDIRADLYSLGCTLYHLLTGQPPFPDGNVLNQMVRHATETPRPVCDFNPDLPDEIQPILTQLLAKQAAQRYQTPSQAAQALQAFLEAQPKHAPLKPGASRRSSREIPIPRAARIPPKKSPTPPPEDVELAPVIARDSNRPEPSWLALHRDWVLAGLGAGVVVIVIAILILTIILRT